MVTWAAERARAGTRVTAVAPLPITTIRFPVTSMSSGHACGCTMVPEKSVMPSKAGR